MGHMMGHGIRLRENIEILEEFFAFGFVLRLYGTE
jgi:hypothetical protein